MIAVDSPDGGILVLNDVWHPWWGVVIDGAEAELIRANVVVRGVRVPPGRHTVRFMFRPITGAFRAAAVRLLHR